MGGGELLLDIFNNSIKWSFVNVIGNWKSLILKDRLSFEVVFSVS